MTTMSEIPKPKFISLLCSVFTFLYTFLLSYPFFILYLMFSIHYILQLLSFLPPVFATASILLIAFLSILTNRTSTECSKSVLGFLLNASHGVQEKVIPKIDVGDEEFYPEEVLELYKTVFETFMIDETDNIVDNLEEDPEEKILQAVESSILKISQHNEEECRKSKEETLTTSSLKEDPIDDGQLETPKSILKERRFEEFLKEVDELEYMDCREVDKSFDKQKTEAEMVKTESIKRRHSRRQSTPSSIDSSEDGGGRTSKKEWQMTLACKLFEEKHSNNVEGPEGMDLLWETYEEKASMENSRNVINHENEESEENVIGYLEDEEDEEEIDVQVCCLHAFKFSGVKMNMGVGGRNLARISKVVKGIRWLRSVTKHGKKMNNTEEKCQLYK